MLGRWGDLQGRVTGTRDSLTKRPGKERLHEAGCWGCAEDPGLLADRRQARSWTSGQVAPVQPPNSSSHCQPGRPSCQWGRAPRGSRWSQGGRESPVPSPVPACRGPPSALEALPPPEVVPVLPAGPHRSPSQRQLSPEWACFLPLPPDGAWSGLPGAERLCLPVSVLPSSGGSLDPRPLGRS